MQQIFPSLLPFSLSRIGGETRKKTHSSQHSCGKSCAVRRFPHPAVEISADFSTETLPKNLHSDNFGEPERQKSDKNSDFGRQTESFHNSSTENPPFLHMDQAVREAKKSFFDKLI